MKLKQKKFVYFNSSEIAKNDIIWGLLELDIDVQVGKNVVDIQDFTEEDVDRLLKELEMYDVAITQNFVAPVAEACFRKKIPYIAWVYDSPQRALFLKEALYDTNYIFMFDHGGIERLSPLGIKHLYYMPLAANIAQTSMLNITEEDIIKYASDIAFVGSLYEKEYMNSIIDKMPVSVKYDFDSWINDNLLIWEKGKSIFQDFPASVIEYGQQILDRSDLDRYNMSEEYIIQILIGAYYLSSKERFKLINIAADRYETKLYTTKTDIEGILAKICPRVNYEDEMYKVFFASKINLNITYRGIETGVPQRIFDIMSVGGFVLSNYQKEIEDLFEIGKEIEVYYNEEDLKNKIDYYMRHEEERIRIGINGYQKVRDLYNYGNLINIIIDTVERDLFA